MFWNLYAKENVLKSICKKKIRYFGFKFFKQNVSKLFWIWKFFDKKLLLLEILWNIFYIMKIVLVKRMKFFTNKEKNYLPESAEVSAQIFVLLKHLRCPKAPLRASHMLADAWCYFIFLQRSSNRSYGVLFHFSSKIDK